MDFTHSRWSQRSFIEWEGGEERASLLPGGAAMALALTHLHLEQLFPSRVRPEPVELDRSLSLQAGPRQGRQGRVLQPHGQGVAVPIQHPGLERKGLQIP